jgi:hypothetical protein
MLRVWWWSGGSPGLRFPLEEERLWTFKGAGCRCDGSNVSYGFFFIRLSSPGLCFFLWDSGDGGSGLSSCTVVDIKGTGG